MPSTRTPPHMISSVRIVEGNSSCRNSAKPGSICPRSWPFQPVKPGGGHQVGLSIPFNPGRPIVPKLLAAEGFQGCLIAVAKSVLTVSPIWLARISSRKAEINRVSFARQDGVRQSSMLSTACATWKAGTSTNTAVSSGRTEPGSDTGIAGVGADSICRDIGFTPTAWQLLRMMLILKMKNQGREILIYYSSNHL